MISPLAVVAAGIVELDRGVLRSYPGTWTAFEAAKRIVDGRASSLSSGAEAKIRLELEAKPE